MQANLHKKISLSLLLLLVSLTILPSAQALGVIPSNHQKTFEPQGTYEYQIKVVSDDITKQVVVYSEGALTEYISIDKTYLTFKEGEKEQFITIKIKQPRSFEKQGLLEEKIIVRDVSANQGQVGATLSVISKFSLLVPYENSYAETKLYVSDFSQEKKSNFVIEINNLGLEDITNAHAFIKIINPYTNQVLTTINSEELRIPKKTKKHVTLPWTPSIPNGMYQAIATTTYNDKSSTHEKTFFIGSESISTETITVNNFQLGGIAKFNLLLKNEWNLPLENVHAIITIKQGTTTYESSTTQSITLDSLESKLVNGYWDTNKVIPGSYDLEVKLYYNDKITSKTFPIVVKQNSIDTGFTANVVKEGGQELNPTYLLILLVIIVLIINIILFKKLFKKKKN